MNCEKIICQFGKSTICNLLNGLVGWWMKQARTIGAASRNQEPVSAFGCCQPKALRAKPSQGKAGRQKKCNSDINQHQLRQEWSEHERLKRNIVERKIYYDQL